MESSDENIKLKIKVFCGKYENCSQSLKLSFGNVQESLNTIQDKIGLDESTVAVVIQIKCLPNCQQSDLEDLIDLINSFVDVTQILTNSECPVSSITASVHEESYEQKYFLITCPLTLDLSAIISGVIQASGINHIDVELKVDEKNQSTSCSLDVDLSANLIELAQEMMKLPNELITLASMFNEADLMFKFNTWANLVDNEIIKKFLPDNIKDEALQAMSGQGLEVLLNKITSLSLKEALEEKEKFIIAAIYSKAVTCFQEISNVNFVVNNYVFKCDTNIPNLFQQMNVPFPDDWNNNANKNFDPSFLPSTFTAPSHEHELTLQNNLNGGLGYVCEKCKKNDRFSNGYGYHCKLCQYDLHPDCALEQ